MTMKPRKVRPAKSDAALGSAASLAVCPNCGAVKIKARTFSDTVDFRGLTIDAEGLHDAKCAKCAHVWSTDAQRIRNHATVRAAYALTRDQVRNMQGLLSGPEIAQVRNDLKLNQREAAALFGGGLNAFNKYESGEVLQSFAMDRLLRLARKMGSPAIGYLRDINAPAAFPAAQAPPPRRAPANA